MAYNWQLAPLISKTQIGGQVYFLKDAEARAAIDALQGAMHFMGVTNDERMVDGWTGKPNDIYTGEATPAAGDVVVYAEKEFVWNGSKWQEFGDLSGIASETGTTVVSVAGNISGTDIANALGESTTSVLGTNTTFTGSITNGTAVTFGTASVNQVSTATNAPIYNLGNASHVEITGTGDYIESVGTTTLRGIASVTENGVLTGTTSSTEKTFATETSINDTENSGVATIGTVSTMKLTQQTATAVTGTTTVHDTPTLQTASIGSASDWNAGSLPSKEADKFNAGTMTTLDTSKFNGGTLAAANTSNFAIEGVTVSMGSGAVSTGTTVDSETLIFTTAGTSAAVTAQGTFTPAEIQNGFYSPGTAPSFTEGAFSAGTLPSLTVTATSVGIGIEPGSAIEVATGNTSITFATGALASDATGSTVVTGVAPRYLHTGTDTITGNYVFSTGDLPVANSNASTVVTSAESKSITVAAASDAGTVANVAIVGNAVNVATSDTDTSVMPSTAGVSITVGANNQVDAVTSFTPTAITFTAAEEGTGHKHTIPHETNA